MADPVVHLLCGLNGAGKTTFAHRVQAGGAVRFSLDEWMLRLHGLPYDDPAYPSLLPACQALIWDTVEQVLAAGADVVIDWNAWSRARRAESARRAAGAGGQVVVHHLDVPVAVAAERLTSRNRTGDPHAHRIPPEQAEHAFGYFEPPSADEGLVICHHVDGRSCLDS